MHQTILNFLDPYNSYLLVPIAILIALGVGKILLSLVWPTLVDSVKPNNEYVLVTGCDSGIGYQAAKLFDSLGFTVFAGCLFPNSPGASSLAKETSDKLKIILLDITDEDSVQSCFSVIEDQTKEGGLWGLVNNAGVLTYGHFEWFSWNQCQKQVDVNLLGTIRVTKAFLPLIQKRQGRIVTITSVNGVLAYPGLSVYCATKFALEGFSDSLRLELRRSNVKVITVQLGDFAKLTSIFSNHEKDVLEMWKSMPEPQQEREREYFWHFHEIVEQNCGILSPPSFESSPLHGVLKDAMTAGQPQIRYLCMPPRHKIALKLFLLCPTSLSDFLMAKLLK